MDPVITTVLDNEKVNVLSIETPAEWAGEHTHPGNQMAIVLSPVTVTYKEEGKEFSKKYDVGDVIWVDAVTHDHKPDVARKFLMVTLK